MGEYDDYNTDPLIAFTDAEEAKSYCEKCNEEVKRIKWDLDELKSEYQDVLIIPDHEETEEEIEAHGLRAMEYAEKQVKILKTHLYDEDILNEDGLNYQVAELELVESKTVPNAYIPVHKNKHPLE
jgi:hypothetical protein